jgi:uncharacterized protein YndB with AHSA1/START domain
VTNTATLELDEFLPYPPAKVWRLLTEPGLMDSWLMPTDGFAPVVGTRFRFVTEPAPRASFSGVVYCEVLEIEPERLLRISWATVVPALDSVVTWRLVPEGSGTRMLLTHTGFDLDDPDQARAFERMNGGRWNVLRRMVAELDRL